MIRTIIIFFSILFFLRKCKGFFSSPGAAAWMIPSFSRGNAPICSPFAQRRPWCARQRLRGPRSAAVLPRERLFNSTNVHFSDGSMRCGPACLRKRPALFPPSHLSRRSGAVCGYRCKWAEKTGAPLCAAPANMVQFSFSFSWTSGRQASQGSYSPDANSARVRRYTSFRSRRYMHSRRWYFCPAAVR